MATTSRLPGTFICIRGSGFIHGSGFFIKVKTSFLRYIYHIKKHIEKAFDFDKLKENPQHQVTNKNPQYQIRNIDPQHHI